MTVTSVLETLERRIKWLSNRVLNNKDLSFDRREKNALEHAVAAIEHHVKYHKNCDDIWGE